MGKYSKIYDLLECKIDVPINDMDAWQKYPKHRWIYNKAMICQYQGISYAPMPIEPKKYPVIIKPIINLYGMGLNIIKVNNKDEFYDNWYNNNFWMEFLEGEHLSWDVIILNGKIVFHTCFIGHKDDTIVGKFDYWESTDKVRIIPDIITKLVDEHFKDYCGCLNVETINNKMIECHLRIGDIDCFPTLNILKGIVATYEGKEYDWNVKLDKVYFYPVWSSNEYEDECEYIKKNIVPMLKNNKYIHDYDVDDVSLGSPSATCKRLMWFTCSYKEYSDQLRKSIYKAMPKAIL